MRVVGFAATLAAIALGLSGCGHNGDTRTANVRLLNLSTGYSSLDVFASNDNATTAIYTPVMQGVSYETLSGYATPGAGTYSLHFQPGGVSSVLTTATGQNFTDYSHTTYVGYGSANYFAAFEIPEDNVLADSGFTKVTVYNASEAGAVDVYITVPNVDLNDVSPTVTSLGEGKTAAITLNSGSYRLRVTGTGDNTDLRLDVPTVTFNSTDIDSLLLASTTGGVLVNAMLLPQQGSLTKYDNTQARVRGAVGITGGTSVNATIAGASILANATVGNIGGIYSIVTAGTVSVSLTVGGAAVTVPEQTLEPGGDYTFLVWTNSSGTQVSLISDDNAVPASIAATDARVRVLNGASGLGDPVSMEVNFVSAATDVLLGQASTPENFASGTRDNDLVVSDASTSATISSTTLQTLSAGGVYTMFVSGGSGPSTAVNATLRQDR